MQSKLKEHFPICFVFLLPLFALKFFTDSYPEFFDDAVEVFEFPTDMELLRQEAFRWVSGDRYEAYAQFSEEERDHKYEISAYDKAIQISPQESPVWESRRLALRRLGFD